MITMNLTKMFAMLEPWDCSNSVANLGPDAGRLTWQAALAVAQDHAEWLLGDLGAAVEECQDWADGTGAWEAHEIEKWSTVECLALLVQNVASDLRAMGSDDCELGDLVGVECESGCTYVYGAPDGEVHAQWYGGV